MSRRGICTLTGFQPQKTFHRVWIFESREALEAVYNSPKTPDVTTIYITLHQAAHYAGLPKDSLLTLLVRLQDKGLIPKVIRKARKGHPPVRIYPAHVALIFDHTAYMELISEVH